MQFTFISGNKYVTVLTVNHEPYEILGAVEQFLGELKKPFVFLSQTVLEEEGVSFLRDRELIDVILE
jgi:hypothetical protein